MNVVILYQPRSEHSRSVEEFVHHMHSIYPDQEIILMDVDSVEGSDKAELYDIVQYPAIMVLADDGSLVNRWVGGNLPLVDEVAGYLR